MNLRRLRYFVVLAEELHFGRAATRLHLAQPALTQNLRALEEHWGVSLLTRSSRRVELTEAGAALRGEALKLLAEADAIDRRMRSLALGQSGSLRISYARSAPGGRSHDLVDAFRQSFPQVKLEITSQHTARSIEDLLVQRLDAAFVRTPVLAGDERIEGLELLPIDTEPLLVAVSKSHRLARRKRIERSDLLDQPVVTGLTARAPGFYNKMFGQIWGDAKPRVVLEEPDEEHMLHAVAAGHGITILTQSRAAFIQMAGVAIRPFAEPMPCTDLGLAWMGANKTPALQAFIDLCNRP